jgi:hypothetical protein
MVHSAHEAVVHLQYGKGDGHAGHYPSLLPPSPSSATRCHSTGHLEEGKGKYEGEEGVKKDVGEDENENHLHMVLLEDHMSREFCLYSVSER